MKRRTKADLELELRDMKNAYIDIQRKIEMQEVQLKFYRAIDQHFHLLLTGVVSGMKEGTFPRRSS